MSKRKYDKQTLVCIKLTLFNTESRIPVFTTHSELLTYVWNVFVMWQNIHIFISKFSMICPFCIMFIVVFDFSKIPSFCFRWGMPPALWIRLYVLISFLVRKEPSFLPNHPSWCRRWVRLWMSNFFFLPRTLLGWYFDLQLCRCSIVIPCISLANVEIWIRFIIPPNNEVVGGYIDFTPSVCPSVRPSVCPACRVRSVTSTVLDGFFPY